MGYDFRKSARKADKIPDGKAMKDAYMQSLGVKVEPLPFREGIYYTTAEVCERLGVVRETLARLRKKYEIPYIQFGEDRLGSPIRYNGTDLLEFLGKVELRKK